MKNIFFELKKENIIFKYFFLNYLFFPLFIIKSPGVVNFFLILNIFLFLILCLVKKIKLTRTINSYQNFLYFLFLLLLINLITSHYFEDSLTRTLGFFRFIFFIQITIYVFTFKNFKYTKILIFSYFLFISIVSFDLIFEFIFGKNFLGYSSGYTGRLAGLTGDELIIGHILMCFVFVLFAFISELKIKNFYKLIILISILFISFIIGERGNFLRVLTGLILFLTFSKNFSKKNLLLIVISLAIFSSVIIKFNENFYLRYYEQFVQQVISKPINFISNTPYGPHYRVALEMFKDNKFTGVGLKNFRNACSKYEHYANDSGCTTHPHQIHLEILSELGLINYFLFIYFWIFFFFKNIKIYKINKNNYHLACLSFVFVNLFLPLPTGSFFTTIGATIFWFNFALAVSFGSLKKSI